MVILEKKKLHLLKVILQYKQENKRLLKIEWIYLQEWKFSTYYSNAFGNILPEVREIGKYLSPDLESCQCQLVIFFNSSPQSNSKNSIRISSIILTFDLWPLTFEFWILDFKNIIYMDFFRELKILLIVLNLIFPLIHFNTSHFYTYQH